MTEAEIRDLGEVVWAAVLRYVRTGQRPSPEEAEALDLWNDIVFARQVALYPEMLGLMADLATEFPPPPSPAEA
jgi:hypothetical protein